MLSFWKHYVCMPMYQVCAREAATIAEAKRACKLGNRKQVAVDTVLPGSKVPLKAGDYVSY